MATTSNPEPTILVIFGAGGDLTWRKLIPAIYHLVKDAWLDDYLARNWDSARHSAGTYQIEAEGLRLFARIEGDYFSILGLPLLPLLGYLGDRGFIAA